MDEKYRNLIEETLDMFDFHSAEDFFKINDWQYGNENSELYYPDYLDLKRMCRKLCIDAVNNLIKNKPFPFTTVSSGRFFILCHFIDDENINLRVSLEVESVYSDDYD